DAARGGAGLGAREPGARVETVESAGGLAEVGGEGRPPGRERIQLADNRAPAAGEEIAREHVLAPGRLHERLAARPGEHALPIHEVEVAELLQPVRLGLWPAAEGIREVLDLDAVKREGLVPE